MNSRNILRHIVPVFLFLTTHLVLVSQAPFQNPIILNQKNGLPSNFVRDIAQDYQGFIWIATSNGLCRYDGSKIELYNHVANDTSKLYTRSVTEIHIDASTGHIWLATNQGLHVYNPLTDTFKSYLPIPGDSNQLANVHIDYTYQDRQDRIWIGNFIDGLALYRPQTDDFEQIYPSDFFDIKNENEAAWYNQVNGFVQDYQQDHIYWLMNKRGLVRWDRQREEMVLMPEPPETLISLANFTSVKTIYQHFDGTIFIGLWSNGFLTWHPNTRIWRHYNYSNDVEEENHRIKTIYTIVPRDSTCVYLGNNDNALFLYDLKQQKIAQIWKGSRKAKEQYTLQLIDRDGNLWAGLNRGISIYNPLAQNMTLNMLPTKGDNEEFLYRPNGLIFSHKMGRIIAAYSMSKGLYSFDLQTSVFTPLLGPDDQLALNFVHGLIETADREIIVLSPSDLYTYLPEERRLKKIRPTEEWNGARFIEVVQDSRKDFWIGTYEHGIFRYDYKNKIWKQYQEEIETPTEDRHAIWLWGFVEDRQGKVWFRAGTGYSVYVPEEDRFLNFPFQKGSKNNYLAIGDLCLDGEGMLWVLGNEQNIGLINTETPQAGVVRELDMDQMLIFNGPHEIILDDNKDMWIVDDEKLARYNSKSQKMEYFNKYYGIPPYDDELDMEPLNSCNLATLPDGRVVLQYRRGIALFHPDSLKRNDKLPIPYLTTFQVNNQDYPLDSSITVKKQIRLRANEKNISFEFSAINFSVPHLTSFRYRLQGEKNENWIEAGDRRYAAFTNVPGGDYTLQVMAANSDGKWNEIPFELAIHLATPWYQTALFKISILVFWVSLIYAIYKWRVNQIREQQNQKAVFEKKLANVEMNALRAQMNPHFIFNCLNSIDSFIIRNETRKASEYLNDFARLIRLILQNSRSNLINLKDELEALKLYLQMEQLRFREKFDYEIIVDPSVNLPATVIPPMLIQPYVENAVWHGLLHKKNASGGKVEIELKEEKDCLVISIKDNGIGRKKAEEIKSKKRTQSRKSMGTQITGDRIAVINHLYSTAASADTIDLEDEHGNATGTKILIRIPI